MMKIKGVVREIKSPLPALPTFVVREIHYEAYGPPGVLEVVGDCNERKFRITFSEGVAHFWVTDEENLMSLWSNVPEGQDVPTLFLLEGSSVVEDLCNSEPVFEVHHRAVGMPLLHFVISSGADVVQVLSYDYPKIIEE